MFRSTNRAVAWLVPLLLTSAASAESYAPFADYREPCSAKGMYFLVEYTGRPGLRTLGGPTRITVARQRDLNAPNLPCAVRLEFQQGGYVVVDQVQVKVVEGDTVLRTLTIPDIPEQVTVDADSLCIAALGWRWPNRAKLARSGAIRIYSHDTQAPWIIEMSELFPDAIEKCSVSRSTVDWLHSAWFDSLDHRLVVLGHKCCNEQENEIAGRQALSIVVLDTNKRTVSPGTLDYVTRAILESD
jgi:hypothetical protein